VTLRLEVGGGICDRLDRKHVIMVGNNDDGQASRVGLILRRGMSAKRSPAIKKALVKVYELHRGSTKKIEGRLATQKPNKMRLT
jgi:hypothetical protein